MVDRITNRVTAEKLHKFHVYLLYTPVQLYFDKQS